MARVAPVCRGVIPLDPRCHQRRESLTTTVCRSKGPLEEGIQVSFSFSLFIPFFIQATHDLGYLRIKYTPK